MRAVLTGLQFIVLAGLVFLAGTHYQQTDFAIAERQQAADEKLKDYVISHDLEYLRNELLEVHQARWQEYADASKRSRRSFFVLCAAALIMLLSIIISFRRPPSPPAS